MPSKKETPKKRHNTRSNPTGEELQVLPDSRRKPHLISPAPAPRKAATLPAPIRSASYGSYGLPPPTSPDHTPRFDAEYGESPSQTSPHTSSSARPLDLDESEESESFESDESVSTPPSPSSAVSSTTSSASSAPSEPSPSSDTSRSSSKWKRVVQLLSSKRKRVVQLLSFLVLLGTLVLGGHIPVPNKFYPLRFESSQCATGYVGNLHVTASSLWRSASSNISASNTNEQSEAATPTSASHLSSFTKNQLRSNLLEHITSGRERQPPRPLCMLGVRGPSSSWPALVDEVVGEMSRVYSNGSDRVLMLSADKLKGKDWANEASQLIDSHFSVGEAGLVVIQGVDLLPEPQHFLWRFCDDDAARHKQGVFLFLSSPNSSLSQQVECNMTAKQTLSQQQEQQSQLERSASAYFHKLWSRDKSITFDPLWARVANLVARFC